MEQTMIMYRCAHCPHETETCVKLDYDTHQMCVDNSPEADK